MNTWLERITLIKDKSLKAGFHHADFSTSADFLACVDCLAKI